MKKMILGLALIAAPAFAQDTRPVLWGDLRAGMTKEEAKPLTPPRGIEVISGCYGRVETDFHANSLASVTVAVGTVGCTDRVLTALVDKYGPAIEAREEKVPGNRFMDSYMNHIRIFQSDTMVIRFEDKGDDRITYTPRSSTSVANL